MRIKATLLYLLVSCGCTVWSQEGYSYERPQTPLGQSTAPGFQSQGNVGQPPVTSQVPQGGISPGDLPQSSQNYPGPNIPETFPSQANRPSGIPTDQPGYTPLPQQPGAPQVGTTGPQGTYGIQPGGQENVPGSGPGIDRFPPGGRQPTGPQQGQFDQGTANGGQDTLEGRPPFPPSGLPQPAFPTGQFPIPESISGQHFDDGTYEGGDYSAIPGEPGVDYPIYTEIPLTSFRCSQQRLPGYYADVEARCQVFHVCANNLTYNFLCPNGTIFHQEYFVCVWWNQFECESAPSLYGLNEKLYDYNIKGRFPTVQRPAGFPGVIGPQIPLGQFPQEPTGLGQQPEQYQGTGQPQISQDFYPGQEIQRPITPQGPNAAYPGSENLPPISDGSFPPVTSGQGPSGSFQEPEGVLGTQRLPGGSSGQFGSSAAQEPSGYRPGQTGIQKPIDEFPQSGRPQTSGDQGTIAQLGPLGSGTPTGYPVLSEPQPPGGSYPRPETPSTERPQGTLPEPSQNYPQPGRPTLGYPGSGETLALGGQGPTAINLAQGKPQEGIREPTGGYPLNGPGFDEAQGQSTGYPQAGRPQEPTLGYPGLGGLQQPGNRYPQPERPQQSEQQGGSGESQGPLTRPPTEYPQGIRPQGPSFGSPGTEGLQVPTGGRPQEGIAGLTTEFQGPRGPQTGFSGSGSQRPDIGYPAPERPHALPAGQQRPTGSPTVPLEQIPQVQNVYPQMQRPQEQGFQGSDKEYPGRPQGSSDTYLGQGQTQGPPGPGRPQAPSIYPVSAEMSGPISGSEPARPQVGDEYPSGYPPIPESQKPFHKPEGSKRPVGEYLPPGRQPQRPFGKYPQANQPNIPGQGRPQEQSSFFSSSTGTQGVAPQSESERPTQLPKLPSKQPNREYLPPFKR